jgi:hypothetical protein
MKKERREREHFYLLAPNLTGDPARTKLDCEEYDALTRVGSASEKETVGGVQNRDTSAQSQDTPNLLFNRKTSANILLHTSPQSVRMAAFALFHPLRRRAAFSHQFAQGSHRGVREGRLFRGVKSRGPPRRALWRIEFSCGPFECWICDHCCVCHKLLDSLSFLDFNRSGVQAGYMPNAFMRIPGT